ncbi:hypothetical protein [Alkalihalobacterium chitinilyticum]|uniref:Uncharacterized protein n=1 Tax=Alkalihalobacterium chitinilyticum TaxID=2980103 RepID=A0ABT5VCK5_9BACI|nr:hypothetical protein [Alkalihalobacterium chitinilyticum]MDE5413185.1 hypothetical protein [Alkalihalobacterium chitinilyticum]
MQTLVTTLKKPNVLFPILFVYLIMPEFIESDLFKGIINILFGLYFLVLGYALSDGNKKYILASCFLAILLIFFGISRLLS